MTTEQNKQFIRRFIDEVLNRDNLDALNQLVPEDFVEEDPFPGQGPGRKGLRDVLAMFHKAFPGMKWTADEQIAEGEKVVTRFTFTGTQKGEFLGVRPTGKSVRSWGVVLDVVENGRLVRSRIIMDVMGLMGQLTAK
jgi:steroid delta-isomerase-like uncharacterized protein